MGTFAFAFTARILTQEEMGVVVALTLTVSAVQIISDLGFSSGLAKFVAEERGKGGDYTPILFGGVLTKVLMAVSLVAVCAGFAPQLSQIFLKSDEYAFLFRLVSVDIFFACIFTTVNSLLLGLNKIAEMATLDAVLSITRHTFAVLFLLLGYKLMGLVGGWLLGDLTYVVLACAVLWKGKHLRVHPVSAIAPHLRKLTKFSLPLFVTAVIAFLYSWFDRAILLSYVPLTEVALYNVAYTAFGVLYLLPTALSTSLFPYFSEQYGRDMRDRIADAFRTSTRYIILFYTPLAFGLAITANPVLALFAGEKYVYGDAVLTTLCLFGVVGGIGTIFGILLLVYNMTLMALAINAISIGFGVAASFLLLPSLGVVGMAVVKGASMIVSLVLSIIVLKNRVSIRFDREAVWKGLSAALLMSVIVWLTVQICSSRYLLPAYILVGGVVYACALRFMGAIKKYDIQLIRNLIGRRVSPVVDLLEKILIS